MKIPRWLYLLVPVAFSAYVNCSVFLNRYSPVLIYWWLSTILIGILVFYMERKTGYTMRFRLKDALTLFTVTLFPVIVRILCYRSNWIHGDDIITGYFSAHIDLLKYNFFSLVPSDPAEWVAQFPAPYFFLQKMFFTLFGESLLTIKLSVLPYVGIVSVMTFLITRKLYNTGTAAIAVMFASFLPVSLYLETLGLHFISSTAVFLIFLYLSLLYSQRRSPLISFLLGVSCGFCYLFYLTSFIAIPYLLFLFIYDTYKIWDCSVLKNILIVVFGIILTLSPFLTFFIKYGDIGSFRPMQVSLLTGTWSGVPEKVKKGQNPVDFLRESTVSVIKSFNTDGVGGHGGYDFGHLAFFEKYTFYYFIFTLGISIVLVFKKRQVVIIYIILIMSFLTTVFSTLPPAYHRMSLSFPFIAIILSCPLYIFLRYIRIPDYVKFFIIIFFIFGYSILNLNYFQQAVTIDAIKSTSNNKDLELSQYLSKNFPHRNMYVASYPGFGFQKVYYFSQNKTIGNIKTDYHSTYLDTFNTHEKYVYVILFPHDFDDTFRKLDKNGRIIEYSDKFSLFVN